MLHRARCAGTALRQARLFRVQPNRLQLPFVTLSLAFSSITGVVDFVGEPAILRIL